MKKIIPIVIVLIALTAAGLWWAGKFRTDDPNVLKVSGNIELTQVDVSFKIAGKLVERAVDEGATVKKGMLIARLDRDLNERQKQRDEAGADSAQTQMVQMNTSVQLQRATLEADIELRKAEIAQAQAHLDELLAGSRRQEITQSQAMVTDARSQQDQASRDWERAQTLYKNEDISTSQYDQFRARFQSAGALLKQAEEKSAMVLEGPRKEEIASARAQLARSQAALRMSQANRFELKRKEQEINTRRAEIDRANAQVAISNSQLSDTAVYAPIDGVVLSKSAEPGEVLAAGTSVVMIGDLDHPWLRAYVNEKDLGRVKLGGKVKLSTDSYPGKAYWGTISFIASQAEFTPKQIQTQEERIKLVYRIKIDVANVNRELKSNMPVDAEILL